MQILRFRFPPLKRGLILPQRLCYMSSTLFWLFPIPAHIFLIAPLFYLFFALEIFVASGGEFMAYTMIYMIVNLMMQNYLYGRFRWPWISELYEYVQSVYLLPAVISVMLNPRKPTFKVTAKDETLDQSYISELGGPFYIIFGFACRRRHDRLEDRHPALRGRRDIGRRWLEPAQPDHGRVRARRRLRARQPAEHPPRQRLPPLRIRHDGEVAAGDDRERLGRRRPRPGRRPGRRPLRQDDAAAIRFTPLSDIGADSCRSPSATSSRTASHRRRLPLPAHRAYPLPADRRSVLRQFEAMERVPGVAAGAISASSGASRWFSAVDLPDFRGIAYLMRPDRRGARSDGPAARADGRRDRVRVAPFACVAAAALACPGGAIAQAPFDMSPERAVSPADPRAELTLGPAPSLAPSGPSDFVPSTLTVRTGRSRLRLLRRRLLCRRTRQSSPTTSPRNQPPEPARSRPRHRVTKPTKASSTAISLSTNFVSRAKPEGALGHLSHAGAGGAQSDADPRLQQRHHVAPEASRLRSSINGRPIIDPPIAARRQFYRISMPIPPARSGRHERHRLRRRAAASHRLHDSIRRTSSGPSSKPEETGLIFEGDRSTGLASLDDLPAVGVDATGVPESN